MPSLVSLPLAAALPDKPGILETLGYQLNGLIVVFLALASIWLLLEIIGHFFKRLPHEEPQVLPVAAPRVASAAAPAAAPAAPAGLTPELIVAVTAAVHHVLGDRVRISAIVPMSSNSWAREGRRQIFSSHQPR